MDHCTATNRQGNRCGRFPTRGKRVCHYHGGARRSGAQPGNANALKHGLYSPNPGLTPEEVGALAEATATPAPAVLAQDAALIRVLVNRVLAAEKLPEDQRAEIISRALERAARLTKIQHLVAAQPDTPAAPSAAPSQAEIDRAIDAVARRYGRTL